MFSVYKKVDNRLVEIEKPEKGSWINVFPPFNHDSLKQLSDQLEIPFDYLIDSLDVDERSRFEKDEDVRLIVIKCSILNEVEQDNDAPYVTVPIGIIYNEEIILTISPFETPIIGAFLKGMIKNFDPAKREHFILQIFDRTVYYFLHHLQDINNKRMLFEKQLDQSLRNQELTKLMNIEKSLVYFVTSLRINELMMMKIQRTNFLRTKSNEEEEEYLQDIIIDNSQALEMSNVYTNILSGTMNAFASIISNNLNSVMKRLTSVTIVLMVPTLVASFYGMNMPVPFEESQSIQPFIYTILASIVLSILVVWFFMKKQLF